MTPQQMTSYARFDPSKRVTFNEELTATNQEDTWTVMGALSYYHGERQDEYWVRVPHGYRVTGAQVHKPLRKWLRPCDPGGQAAIIHCYLCNTGKVRHDGAKRMVDRRQANRIFLEAMGISKVPFFKRWALYWSAVVYGKNAPQPESSDTTK